MIGERKPIETRTVTQAKRHYPVSAGAINFRWKTNLKNYVWVEMSRTLRLKEGLAQEKAQKKGEPQEAAVRPRIRSDVVNTNVSILSRLLDYGSEKTFAKFLNWLHDSTIPIHREWFETLAASELFVIDEKRQFDRITKTASDCRDKHLSVVQTINLLFKRRMIDFRTMDKMCRAKSNSDTMDKIHRTKLNSDEGAEILLQDRRAWPEKFHPSHTNQEIPPLRWPAAATADSCASAVKPQQIRMLWFRTFKERMPFAISLFTVSPFVRVLLERRGIAPPHILLQLKQAATNRERATIVLEHLQEHGTQNQFCTFLNLLGESGDIEPLNGTLFDSLAYNPGLVRRQPTPADREPSPFSTP